MIPATEDKTTARSRVDTKPMEADHDALRALMERLAGVLTRVCGGDSSREGEMLQGIDEFRHLLMLHLDREEKSGVLEQAAEREPRCAPRVEQLIHEHAELRRDMEALCTSIQAGRWGEFQADFSSFCSTLSTHERAENEMLMDVYLDDIGGRG